MAKARVTIELDIADSIINNPDDMNEIRAILKSIQDYRDTLDDIEITGVGCLIDGEVVEF